MSLASRTVNNPVINNLVQSSLESENKYLRLKWIPYKEIANITPTHIDNVYHAVKSDGVGETTTLETAKHVRQDATNS